MKSGGLVKIWALSGVLLSAPAFAATSDGGAGGGPYDSIVERNVFNLHPPAVQDPTKNLPPPVPPPKITLTGITTILGKKVTFLTLPASKPGQPPESLMLAEGQAQNDVEVKGIDEKAGIVKVVNHGEQQTLDFETNGAKPPPGPPNQPLPAPSTPPPGVSLPPPANVIRPIRSLPGHQSEITPEEQTALIEVQRMKYMQGNNPMSKLLPPTELTPEVTGQNGQAPQ